MVSFTVWPCSFCYVGVIHGIIYSLALFILLCRSNSWYHLQSGPVHFVTVWPCSFCYVGVIHGIIYSSALFILLCRSNLLSFTGWPCLYCYVGVIHLKTCCLKCVKLISDIIWWHKSGSALGLVIAWCHQARSHYLNQSQIARFMGPI